MNWLDHVLAGVRVGLVQAPVGRTFMDTPSGHAGILPRSSRDVKLVNALKADHRKILDIHERIGQLLTERNYTEIPAQLVALRTRLETHILTENVRLYAFLEHLFQGDAGRLEELEKFRAATNAMLLVVLKFIKHHRRTTFDESRLLAFAEEHRQVGALLASHAAQEEHGLYRLYPLA